MTNNNHSAPVTSQVSSIMQIVLALLLVTLLITACTSTNQASNSIPPTSTTTGETLPEQSIQSSGEDEMCSFALATNLDSISEEDRQALSTPELIQKAVDNDEITSEQRLVYIAYAVYDYSALPEQFQSNVAWSGTLYVKELNEVATSESTLCEFDSCVQAELHRLIANTVICND